MFGFLKYLWNNYKLDKEVKLVDKKMNNMIMDMKQGKLKGNEPKAEWARLQYERYKLKGSVRR